MSLVGTVNLTGAGSLATKPLAIADDTEPLDSRRERGSLSLRSSAAPCFPAIFQFVFRRAASHERDS